jgi:hypothetical protein
LPKKLFVNEAHNFIRIKAKNHATSMRRDFSATRKILSNEPPVAFPLSRRRWAKLFWNYSSSTETSLSLSAASSVFGLGGGGGEHKERQISAHLQRPR